MWWLNIPRLSVPAGGGAIKRALRAALVGMSARVRSALSTIDEDRPCVRRRRQQHWYGHLAYGCRRRPPAGHLANCGHCHSLAAEGSANQCGTHYHTGNRVTPAIAPTGRPRPSQRRHHHRDQQLQQVRPSLESVRTKCYRPRTSPTPVCRSGGLAPKSNKITAANTGCNGISFHTKGAEPGRATPAAPGRVGHTDRDILRAASDLMVRLLLRCAANRRSGGRWRGIAIGFFWPARTLRCGWQPASATF